MITPNEHERPGWGSGWFIVLPDSPAAAVAARWATSLGGRVHPHRSGRPWLIGCWADEEFAVAEVDEWRLALVGSCPVDAERLVRAARRCRELGDLDGFARSLPGSFHLVASLGGRLRVQGSAAGVRLVFYTRLDGVTVAADRADILAALVGAGLDERQVAVRLLSTSVHPLLMMPPWRDVAAVEPGAYLLVDPDGGARERRWWSPPIPDRPLSAGAPRVAEALADAVDAHTSRGGTVSCDLSGGMDSTAVCFLAARGPATVVASTFCGRDPLEEDVVWARRAAAHLPQVEHLVVGEESVPGPYDDLGEFDDVLDEPTLAVVARRFWTQRLSGFTARGSRVHLTGVGGDHVTWCSPGHYHRLLRRRPRRAVHQLRGFRALFHWPWGETLQALADGRSYPRWLADAAGDLHRRPPRLGNSLGWAVPPRLPAWATPAASDAAREVLLAAAATVKPLAADRGQHADLANVQAGTRLARQLEQMGARLGLPIVSPFFDDRVVEACLAVRPEERVTPWRYRPLLVAAMRGIVPDDCLERRTKAVGTQVAARAVGDRRAELLELWDGSRLAQMGLIDEGRLRASVHSLMPESERALLDVTISVELWLRAVAASRVGLGGRPVVA